jgi:transcriptional regulator with AAA-type ATPase domain
MQLARAFQQEKEKGMAMAQSLNNEQPQIPFCKCTEANTALLIGSIAERRSNLVLLGETGTGKSSQVREIYSQWLGSLSPEERKRREDARECMLYAFLDPQNFPDHEKIIQEHRRNVPKLKCLPDEPICTNLVGASAETAPAELFGVLPGVYTEVDFRLPLIAMANQSMLFIDELRYVPPMVQAQLLTTVQDRSFIPKGGMEKHRFKNLDVWYVAASTPPYHALLPELIYRLGEYAIELPPLDKIKSGELLDELLKWFLKEEALKEEARRRKEVSPRVLSPEAMKRLREHEWPGNLRQLENVIHRAIAFAGSRPGPIEAEDIDRALKFDPADYLAGSDLLVRLRALFREGAVEDTPLTRKQVDKMLVEVFESEMGRSKAMELLKIGRQAYETIIRGETRRRSKRREEDNNN